MCVSLFIRDIKNTQNLLHQWHFWRLVCFQKNKMMLEIQEVAKIIFIKLPSMLLIRKVVVMTGLGSLSKQKYNNHLATYWNYFNIWGNLVTFFKFAMKDDSIAFSKASCDHLVEGGKALRSTTHHFATYFDIMNKICNFFQICRKRRLKHDCEGFMWPPCRTHERATGAMVAVTSDLSRCIFTPCNSWSLARCRQSLLAGNWPLLQSERNAFQGWIPRILRPSRQTLPLRAAVLPTVQHPLK